MELVYNIRSANIHARFVMRVGDLALAVIVSTLSSFYFFYIYIVSNLKYKFKATGDFIF